MLEGYVIKCIVAIVFLYVMKVYWKEVMAWFDSSEGDKGGGSTDSLSRDFAKGTSDFVKGIVPKSARQATSRWIDGKVASIGGYIGGLSYGISSGLYNRLHGVSVEGPSREKSFARREAQKRKERQQELSDLNRSIQGGGFFIRGRSAFEASESRLLDLYLDDQSPDGGKTFDFTADTDSILNDSDTSSKSYYRKAVMIAFGDVNNMERAYLLLLSTQNQLDSLARDLEETNKLLVKNNAYWTSGNSDPAKLKKNIDRMNDLSISIQDKRDALKEDYRKWKIREGKEHPEKFSDLTLNSIDRKRVQKSIKKAQKECADLLYGMRDFDRYLVPRMKANSNSSNGLVDYNTYGKASFDAVFIRALSATENIVEEILYSGGSFSSDLRDAYRKISQEANERRRELFYFMSQNFDVRKEMMDDPFYGGDDARRLSNLSLNERHPFDPVAMTATKILKEYAARFQKKELPSGTKELPSEPKGLPSGPKGLPNGKSPLPPPNKPIPDPSGSGSHPSPSGGSHPSPFPSSKPHKNTPLSPSPLSSASYSPQKEAHVYEASFREVKKEDKEKVQHKFSGFVNEFFGNTPQKKEAPSMQSMLQGEGSSSGISFVKGLSIHGELSGEMGKLKDYRKIANMGIKDKIDEDLLWGKKGKPKSRHIRIKEVEKTRKELRKEESRNQLLKNTHKKRPPELYKNKPKEKWEMGKRNQGNPHQGNRYPRKR